MKRKLTVLTVVVMVIAILFIITTGNEPKVTDSRSDTINNVLPDGYTIHVNSGMNWNIRIASGDVADAEKLVEATLGNDEYKKYVSLPQLADKSLYVIIYETDPGDGSSVPYIFLFDNNSNELLDYMCLENSDIEATVTKVLIALEKFSQQ